MTGSTPSAEARTASSERFELVADHRNPSEDHYRQLAGSSRPRTGAHRHLTQYCASCDLPESGETRCVSVGAYYPRDADEEPFKGPCALRQFDFRHPAHGVVRGVACLERGGYNANMH